MQVVARCRKGISCLQKKFSCYIVPWLGIVLRSIRSALYRAPKSNTSLSFQMVAQMSTLSNVTGNTSASFLSGRGVSMCTSMCAYTTTGSIDFCRWAIAAAILDASYSELFPVGEGIS